MIVDRYVFDTGVSERKGHQLDAESFSSALKALHRDSIGSTSTIKTPFGIRPMVYADWTASGRSMQSIEHFIENSVLPAYGNTHSLTTATARQSTFFRSEARNLIRNYLNATHEDSLIFAGQGATSCLKKLIDILKGSNWGNDSAISSVPTRDRWGAVECDICDSIKFKNEGEFRSHIASDSHKKREKSFNASQTNKRSRLIVFLCDPSNHHSAILPFREMEVESLRTEKTALSNNSLPPSTIFRCFMLPLNPITLTIDIEKTRSILETLSSSVLDTVGNPESAKDTENIVSVLPICLISAVSNITGLHTNVHTLSEHVHSHGGICIWDLSAAIPHGSIDMNPPLRPLGYADAAFYSSHKLLGGPGGSGVLVLKKKWQKNKIPVVPGGGTVFFVAEDNHSFIYDAEEREESGTPDLLGCIRAGLAVRAMSLLPNDLIRSAESKLSEIMLRVWRSNPAIRLLSPKESSSIISFTIRHGDSLLHHHFVSAVLNDLFGVQARSGCMCAGPYAEHLLGMSTCDVKEIEKSLLASGHEILRPGFVRVSIHYSMTEQEATFVAHAVNFVAKYGWCLLPLYTFDVHTGEFSHRLDSRQKSRLWLTDLKIPGVVTVDASKSVESEGVETCFKKDRHIQDPWKLMMDYQTPCELIGSQLESIAMTEISKSLAEGSSLAVVQASSKSLKSPKLPPGYETYSWYLTPETAMVLLEKMLDLSNKESGLRGMSVAVAFSTQLISYFETDILSSITRALEEISDRNMWMNLKIDSKEEQCVYDTSTVLIRKPTPVLDHVVSPEDLHEYVLRIVRSLQKKYFPRNPQIADENAQELEERHPSGLGEVLIPSTNNIHSQKNEETENSKNTDKNKQISTTIKSNLKGNPIQVNIPGSLRRSVGQAISDFQMIKDGDRILVGLSGGKDSLTLLHCLLEMKKRAPIKFTVAAATVDPQTVEYDPSPLKDYLARLGVEYHLLSFPIMRLAREKMTAKQSICSFCSRMKRGVLYSCMRKNGFNVLALGQHMDDVAESFLMSAFFNGLLNTMKAHYSTPVESGALRICRPLIYSRERLMTQVAKDNQLPVIADNCPACFAAPKERHRVKILLSALEHDHPQVFSNILKAVEQLISKDDSGSVGIAATSQRGKESTGNFVRNKSDLNEENIKPKRRFMDEAAEFEEAIKSLEEKDSLEIKNRTQEKVNQIDKEDLKIDEILEGTESLDFAAEMSMTACGASGECSWVPKNKRSKLVDEGENNNTF